MKFRNTIIILLLLSMSMGAKAFKVKVEIQNKKYLDWRMPNGTKVYLYANPDGKIVNDWTGTTIIDSTEVVDGKFVLEAPDQERGKMWRISTQRAFLYYFFNKDEDLDLVWNKKDRRMKFETRLSKTDSLYKEITEIVNDRDFNPVKKRKAIQWLKSNINTDLGMYLAAFYATTKPMRFRGKPMLSYVYMNEIMDTIPVSQKTNPYFKSFQNSYNVGKSKYVKPDGYKVNGYIDGVNNGMIYLIMPEEGTVQKFIKVDSTEIDRGYFQFTGKLVAPQYAILQLKDGSFPKHLFLENSEIEVNLHAGNNGQNFKNGWMVSKTWGVNYYSTVFGSKSYFEYYEFLDVIKSKTFEEIEAWIKGHPKSRAAYTIVAAVTIKNVRPEVTKRRLKLFDKSFKTFPEYTYAMKELKVMEKVAKGKKAPLFTLPDINGKQVSLKKFRGKYVLIDFWASWCGPCKGEIPNLKEAYKKYKDKGLVVISISSDRDLDAWKKAVEEEGMTWVQLSSKGSTVGKEYGVKGIPHIILLDKKGKIFADKLRGKAITSNIEELINK